MQINDKTVLNAIFIGILYVYIYFIVIRKELHLDETIISTLEAEAKRQNRSLKNYFEYVAIQQAKKLEVPSKEYTGMIDDLLNKFDNNEIEFSSIEEVMSMNGI